MEKLEGYRTWIFFGIALIVAIANLFGFGDFVMSEEQATAFEQAFDFVVIVGGFILRYLTRKPLPFLK